LADKAFARTSICLADTFATPPVDLRTAAVCLLIFCAWVASRTNPPNRLTTFVAAKMPPAAIATPLSALPMAPPPPVDLEISPPIDLAATAPIFEASS
jgi:hypothetical protein